MDEDAFDLFGTSTVRVRKETEEEKRSRHLAERREALGLRPIESDRSYFDRHYLDRLDFSKYEFRGLDLAKGPDWSIYRYITFDEAIDIRDDWRYSTRLPYWRWDTPWYTPTPKVLVPLPKYKASTAPFVQYNPQTEETTIRLPSTPEPAWLKLRGKY